jgi:hypothetical protein
LRRRASQKRCEKNQCFSVSKPNEFAMAIVDPKGCWWRVKKKDEEGAENNRNRNEMIHMKWRFFSFSFKSPFDLTENAKMHYIISAVRFVRNKRFTSDQIHSRICLKLILYYLTLNWSVLEVTNINQIKKYYNFIFISFLPFLFFIFYFLHFFSFILYYPNKV